MTRLLHTLLFYKANSCFVFVCVLCAIADAGAKEWKIAPGSSGIIINKVISHAATGDTITIEAGNYTVKNLQVNQSLFIRGIGMPVLDGVKTGNVIEVNVDDVHISGLELRNSGRSDLQEHAGIRVNHAKGCTISGNRLIRNYFAIYLSGSSSCTVTGNTIEGDKTGEAQNGNGIHLWKCDSINISGNTINSHRDGIYFEFVKNSAISNNTSRENIRYGLHFMFSNGNTYRENLFVQNGAGVAVMYTSNISMINNRFEHNWGDAAYGLLLKDISNSYISGNEFTGNTIGIFMEGSSFLNISHNLFYNNGWALKVMANCYNDSVMHNTFLGNTFDVSTNSSRSENKFSNNYWDKYRGYDLDYNRVGDIPYRPVSLFSMIIERAPFSILLLRSFIVDIIDQVEKIMPALIPETLVDNEPLMYPVDDIGKRS